MSKELTLQEAARETGLSRSYVGRLARQGDIQGRKIGPMWVVDADSLAAYASVWHKPGPKPAREREEALTLAR